MADLRAVTKSRRKQRPQTCPDCRGEMQPVVVTVHSRDGEPMPGIQVVHVPCETCNSTGKVRRAEPTPCCCSLPAGEPRCLNCAVKPRGIHICVNDDFEDWDYAAKIAAMDSPRTGAKTTAAAEALGNGVGERSGQRSNR